MRKTHTEIHLRNEPEHGHKEYKYLYQQMLKDDVIRKAYKKLRKGKTKRKEIQYIDAHLDDEVQKMYDMILNTKPEGVDVPHPELAYKPKKRTPKIIFEHGKRRKIYMPEIHEQWLHHIIVLVLEPIITATAYPYSCGSFPKRGAHYGKRQIERWLLHDPKGTRCFAKLKGDDELITLQIKGDGPIGGLTVTADMNGHVKGYANVPDVILPANAQGKLDVGGAVGAGVLSVIRDMGLKDPYVGQIELQTGEIAEDLTYYFAVSEQVPSVVGLGVLMNRDNTVRQAGGFIVQLMPFAEEEMISKLEENIKNLSSVTTMLDAGKTPEGMLEVLLSGMDLEITDTLPVEFACNCSKDRVRKALISIGREELQSMIDDGETIEVNCHFCNKNYNFTVDELKQMIQ